MADLPAPLVVAGDFNATRDHRQFRDLWNSTGYRDAGDDSGAGLMPTYPRTVRSARSPASTTWCSAAISSVVDAESAAVAVPITTR